MEEEFEIQDALYEYIEKKVQDGLCVGKDRKQIEANVSEYLNDAFEKYYWLESSKSML